jgi:peptide/nickel transport system permease protein
MRFLAGRLAAMAFLLVGITVIAFILVSVAPADPVAANLGPLQASDPSIVRAFRQHYGLDRPLPVQYGLFLLRLIHGDLGQSEQSHRPVAVDLAAYIPATIELAVVATLLAVIVGVGLGTVAAMRHNKPVDQALRILSLGTVSMPTFWLGLLVSYIFFFKLGWLPSSGRLDAVLDAPPHLTGFYTVDSLVAGQFGTFLNALWHLVMPACVLATYNIGVLTRITRASVLDVVHEDHIQVAQAKGLSRFSIVRHILRAALPPVVTVIGFLFAEVMTGTVLIETIFGWPGIGRYAFQSAISLDLPSMMGVTIFVAIVFVSINLAIDITYGLIDPRLRIA